MQNHGLNQTPDEALFAFVADFLKTRGQGRPWAFHAVPIPADGSQRAFFRIQPRGSGRSWIAVENPPTTPFFRRENAAYLNIGRHLRNRGAPIPELLSWDLDKGWFLMEDLGGVRFQERWAEHDGSLDQAQGILAALFHMQVQGAEGFDPAWCCQTPRYDRDLMRRHESNYFRDAFLRGYLGLDRTWRELEGPFEHLAATASRADARFFLHRDFQSRNILVSDSGFGFIDWQGGRLGPPGYDLASFLIDPYLKLPAAAQERLYRFYLNLLHDHHPSLVGPFEETYQYLAIQRNLQILGAFAFLSRNRGKVFFESFIPAAARSLLHLVEASEDPGLRPLGRVVKSTRDLWETA